MEAKPGEVVTDGRNVTIGAPVVIAICRPTNSDASNPTPDAGVESKDETQEDK